MKGRWFVTVDRQCFVPLYANFWGYAMMKSGTKIIALL